MCKDWVAIGRRKVIVFLGYDPHCGQAHSLTRHAFCFYPACLSLKPKYPYSPVAANKTPSLPFELPVEGFMFDQQGENQSLSVCVCVCVLSPITV